MRPTRDEYLADPALARCGSDDDTLRQADRVPGSTGGSRPAIPAAQVSEPVQPPPVYPHPAIAAMEVGCATILCCAAGLLLIVVVIQAYRTLVR